MTDITDFARVHATDCINRYAAAMGGGTVRSLDLQPLPDGGLRAVAVMTDDTTYCREFTTGEIASAYADATPGL